MKEKAKRIARCAGEQAAEHVVSVLERVWNNALIAGESGLIHGEIVVFIVGELDTKSATIVEEADMKDARIV